MSKKLSAVPMLLLALGLAGCARDTLRSDPVAIQRAAPPNFFVGYNGGDAFFPQGLGWVPGSSVEITLVAEPIRVNEGRELSSAPPHVVATVIPDKDGMFGVTGPSIRIPVTRSLCGSPPEWLPRPFFMARDKNGNLRFYGGYTDAYFTFVPCR